MILDDVIAVLNRQGIYKLLVFNSHGGNNFKNMLRELGLKYPKMFLCSSNWFKSLDKLNYFDNDGDHADELETSLILYLRPDLVEKKIHWGKGKENKINVQSLRENWTWTERQWSKATNDTGIGNPMKSTKEKGEKYFKDVCNKISKLIQELCDADLKNLYSKN